MKLHYFDCINKKKVNDKHEKLYRPSDILFLSYVINELIDGLTDEKNKSGIKK